MCQALTGSLPRASEKHRSLTDCPKRPNRPSVGAGRWEALPRA